MENLFLRQEMMLGKTATESLMNKRVLLFGLGGVGGACFEALVRAGIRSITLVDGDVFAPTNLNRQILASHLTLGRKKVEVALERAKEINPNVQIDSIPLFYDPDNPCIASFSEYDYVFDAIDDVRAKLDIIEKCYQFGTPIISALGCGNKIFPEKLQISDIFCTSVDPLARALRQKLRKRGIKKLNVVYSPEKPLPVQTDQKEGRVGSVSFVPPVAGYLMAGFAIRDLLNLN